MAVNGDVVVQQGVIGWSRIGDGVDIVQGVT